MDIITLSGSATLGNDLDLYGLRGMISNRYPGLGGVSRNGGVGGITFKPYLSAVFCHARSSTVPSLP